MRNEMRKVQKKFLWSKNSTRPCNTKTQAIYRNRYVTKSFFLFFYHCRKPNDKSWEIRTLIKKDKLNVAIYLYE